MPPLQAKNANEYKGHPLHSDNTWNKYSYVPWIFICRRLLIRNLHKFACHLFADTICWWSRYQYASSLHISKNEPQAFLNFHNLLYEFVKIIDTSTLLDTTLAQCLLSSLAWDCNKIIQASYLKMKSSPPTTIKSLLSNQSLNMLQS